MLPFYLFFFSLALDFKGVDFGGSLVQFAMFTATVISALIIILRPGSSTPSTKASRIISILLLINITSTILVALTREVDYARYLRVASTYALLTLGYFVGYRSYFDIGSNRTYTLMLRATIVAVIFTAIYGFQSTGLSFTDIRYQILSPMVTFLVPMLAFNIWIRRQNILPSSLGLVMIVSLILVSATRSALISFVCVIASAILLSGAGDGVSLRKLTRSALTVMALSIASLFALYITAPEVILRVLERFFLSQELGFDITTTARLAEINFQLDSWREDLFSILFGKGLGASYEFSGLELEQLFRQLGSEANADDWWFAGHNFFVYSLFAQGIIFCWLLPLTIAYATLKTLRLAITRTSFIHNTSTIYQASSLLCLILLSCILDTIGRSPLNFRMLSLYLGVAVGLSVALRRTE